MNLDMVLRLSEEKVFADLEDEFGYVDTNDLAPHESAEHFAVCYAIHAAFQP